MSQSPPQDGEQGEPPVTVNAASAAAAAAAAPTLSPDDNDLQNEDMSRDHDHGDAGMGYDFEVKEQDRWLPIANVARIMKTALPENAKIAKEAKECMQECVSEFISFITSEASEKCQQEKRKTVNGEDILFAMTSLGFENYGEALKIYLARYRENLVSRGDQKPSAGGSGAPGSDPSYDANSNAANNTNGGIDSNMEGNGEGNSEYGYGNAQF